MKRYELKFNNGNVDLFEVNGGRWVKYADLNKPELDLREFQNKAAEHVTNHEGVLQCFTLGLGEEAGEVVKEVTKLWRYMDKTDPADLNEEEKDHIMEEMGDVLWYLAMISELLGRDVSDLPKHNLDKLEYRRTIKSYSKWFLKGLPDADPEYSEPYWEMIRKVRHYKRGTPGMVYHSLFPNHPAFCGDNTINGIWVKPVDAFILQNLLSRALMTSEKWYDYQMAEIMKPRNLEESEPEAEAEYDSGRDL
jgi:NTP pyrophosphatase (non-canonical NTP hydrolase)